MIIVLALVLTASVSPVVASDTPDNSNSTSVVVPATCSICSDGSPITLPDKKVQIPGFELVDNCQAISTLAKALLPAESEECVLLKSIGTLCGCPKSPDSCELCQGNGPARYAQRELGFLAASFNGIVPTCEIVEAGLHSYPKDDEYCDGSQTYFGEYCGCGATDDVPPLNEQPCSLCPHGGPGNIIRNKTIEVTNFPFQTCGQFADAVWTLYANSRIAPEEPLQYGTDNCFLARTLAMYCGCPNPYRVPPEDHCKLCVVDNTFTSPLPDNLVETDLLQGFGFGDSLMPTCGLLTDFARTFSSNPSTFVGHSLVCSALQFAGAEACGCTPKEEQLPCPVCTEPVPDEFVDKRLGTEWPFDSVACGSLIRSMAYLDVNAIIPVGSEPDNWEGFNCDVYKYSGFICGCNNDMFSYWGSETESQQKTAVWLQRVSAILSSIGSVAIVIDIFRQRHATKLKSQIMLGLSFFDLISSIGWGLGPMATNSGFFELYLGVDPAWFGREDSKFYGSVGTEATCLAQGFVLHWGFTSMLFNMCLAYFYKLLIVNNMRENNFTIRLRLAMLCTPIVIGTTVAILSTQFIVSTPIGCTFGSFSSDGGWAKVVGLFYIPYGPAFVYIPLTTWSIYCRVRSQTGSSNLSISRHAGEISNRSSPGASSEGQSSNVSSDLEGRRRWIWFLPTRAGQNESSLESKVFWESFWYVIAFFASYTIFLFVFAIDGLKEDAYGVLVLASILTPLQGFFNSLNYFRHALGKMWGQGFQKLAESRERIFRLLPSIVHRNSIPSAMQAIRGDYGLSDLPSISELRSSRIKSSRMFRSGIQSVPPAIDEEEYESEQRPSTFVSSNQVVNSGGQRASFSEISSIAAPGLESETSDIASP